MCPKYCDSPAGLGQPRISSPATFSFDDLLYLPLGPDYFFLHVPKGKDWKAQPQESRSHSWEEGVDLIHPFIFGSPMD